MADEKLRDCDVVANVAVKDLAASKDFYQNKLGLELTDDHDFGATFKSGNTQLFVYPTPKAGTAQSTCAHWRVKDLKKITDDLTAKGIEFEHYDYDGAQYDGPIHILGGMKAAWFKDPDGNVLGLNEV
jgi:catechol 2,3-dioxygenase-like lactoylglutathione lyase family enzyme